MTLHEALSRLHDGDLAVKEAEALRERIATEPEVAAAWAEMQALVAALDTLPAPARPMPPVPAVPTAAPPEAPRGHALRTLTPWLLAAAAAAALAFALTRPPPTVFLGPGETTLDGTFLAVVGDSTIDVDGEVRVRVEPAAPAARERQAEDPPMDRSHLVASLAGAAITLVVDRGTALVHQPGEPDRTLGAGDSAAINPPDATPAGADVAPPRGEATVASLQREIEALKLQQALVRGQLAQAAGTPTAFAADLPEHFTPAGFTRRLEEAAAAHPGVTLEQSNCDEFPCLGVLTTAFDGEGWQQRLEAVAKDMKADGYGEETDAMEWISELSNGEESTRVMVFTLWPEDGIDPNTQTRTKVRAEELMQDAAEEIGSENGSP